MADGPTDSQGLLGRRVPRRWLPITVAALIVVIAVVAVVIVLVDRSRDQARRDAQASATSAPAVTSPYDLTELPVDTDLGKVKDAAFVSIYVPNQAGKLTSYGISSQKPAAQALIEAVRDADAATSDEAATLSGADTKTGTSPTITFVFASRETLTFSLDVQHGLIGREGKAWKPKGNLGELVTAATAGP